MKLSSFNFTYNFSVQRSCFWIRRCRLEISPPCEAGRKRCKKMVSLHPSLYDALSVVILLIFADLKSRNQYSKRTVHRVSFVELPRLQVFVSFCGYRFKIARPQGRPAASWPQHADFSFSQQRERITCLALGAQSSAAITRQVTWSLSSSCLFLETDRNNRFFIFV
jgi:hypothetical protein